MTDKDLIVQLKTLKNIHPDKNWVHLTRTSFRVERGNLVSVPGFLAMPAMAGFAALVAIFSVYQAGLINKESASNFAAIVSPGKISDETVSEINEIKQLVEETNPQNPISYSHTVVFNEDSNERDNFKDLLRDRIESKINIILDSFDQLNDGDLAFEISLNPRRFEENFKLVDEELATQVRSLLEQAQEALDEGDLINALDLVNAIEKLLK